MITDYQLKTELENCINCQHYRSITGRNNQGNKKQYARCREGLTRKINTNRYIYRLPDATYMAKKCMAFTPGHDEFCDTERPCHICDPKNKPCQVCYMDNEPLINHGKRAKIQALINNYYERIGK